MFGTNPVSAGTQATISARTYIGLEFGQIVVGVALCIASVAVLRGRGSGAIAMRWIEIAYCFFMLCALAVNAYGFHQSAASRPSYYTGVLIYTAGRYAATTLTQCAYSIVVIGLRRDDLIERQ